MTFAEAGHWFLENHAKSNKRSWKNDRARIADMVRFFGNKKLSQITPVDVQAMRETLRRKGLTEHTVNHYHAELKAVINRLKRLGVFSGENPACQVDMAKVPRARVRFLYPYEEQTLTPAVQENRLLWPYYFTAMHTGMRIKEICNLRVEHVCLANNSIFVPHSKSKRSRYVPLSTEFAEFLNEQILGKKPEQSALSGFSDQWVRRGFKQACHSVGIRDFVFHDLRHTFAQRLLSKGVPIYKVSKILGHSSVVVTEQHYGHLAMSDLKDAIDHIDGVITATCTQVAPSKIRQVVETSDLH